MIFGLFIREEGENVKPTIGGSTAGQSIFDSEKGVKSIIAASPIPSSQRLYDNNWSMWPVQPYTDNPIIVGTSCFINMPHVVSRSGRNPSALARG